MEQNYTDQEESKRSISDLAFKGKDKWKVLFQLKGAL